MYFATYKYDNKEEIGIFKKEDNKIIPMEEIFKDLNLKCPKDMNEFINISNEEIISDIKKLIGTKKFKEIDKNEVKLCAPIPYPNRNLICLGKNYLDHAKETTGLPGGTEDIPKFPIYFTKIADPAIGDGDIIKKHEDITKMIDYEVELGIIIGKDGRDIRREDAEDYIFGYTIVNDVSARNIQRKHGQWFRGKSLETFCPMGPVIAHKSIIPFPVELDIMCKINGEIRQNSNTKNLIFDIPYILSELSKGMTLRAGDIIITGTPAGVGLGFKPYKFLKAGDIIECYIEKIGSLTNKMEE